LSSLESDSELILVGGKRFSLRSEALGSAHLKAWYLDSKHQ